MIFIPKLKSQNCKIMAKSVKKTTKTAPKKAEAKKVAKKSTTKKPVVKVAEKKSVAKSTAKKALIKKTTNPTAKKVVAKKPVAKPTVKKTKGKPVAKKTVTKPAVKKVVAKKSVAKPVAKKSTAKPVAKKTASKPVAKKTAPKKSIVKPVVKKSTAKPVAKKTAPKPVAKKAVAKKSVVKPVKKSSVKLSTTKPEEKQAKLAQRRKKIMEIKNNYDGPVNANYDEDNYDDYKLPIIGRTRFSDAELNEFKTLISKKIAEAREELNFYQDQMKESEMNDDDIKFSGMEDGGHTNDKEHLSAMANRQIKFIQNLESALVRIENKTYGICRMTGNLIDKKRLMAVPHATLSMEAKLGGKKK